MTQEGVNPEVLDMDPGELIPLKEDEVKMVKAGDHPKYSKYFKMLKVSGVGL